MPIAAENLRTARAIAGLTVQQAAEACDALGLPAELYRQLEEGPSSMAPDPRQLAVVVEVLDPHLATLDDLAAPVFRNERAALDALSALRPDHLREALTDLRGGASYQDAVAAHEARRKAERLQSAA